MPSQPLHTDPMYRITKEALSSTELLTGKNDLSKQMVDGAHRFLDTRLASSIKKRRALWNRDFSSRKAYEKSVLPNRKRFMQSIGLIDKRVPARLLDAGSAGDSTVAETPKCTIHRVRWSVLEGVNGEGLLVRPIGKIRGCCVALPDADQTPEQIAGLADGITKGSQFARRLAENGILVIVPTLVSRSDDVSGNPAIAMTNQTHREWLYRQAFEMGRHVIGYEVQKVLGAVDWFKQEHRRLPIAVAGYGEGGLISMYAAACDARIDACLVSGYFTGRQEVWGEPIYRNVWRLLAEFGDAEIASLIAPRPFIVEHSRGPVVNGPPAVREGRRNVAAPGNFKSPKFADVQSEYRRYSRLARLGKFAQAQLIAGKDGKTVPFGSEAAIRCLLQYLNLDGECPLTKKVTVSSTASFDAPQRQAAQVREISDHVQKKLRVSDHVRDEFFLNRVERRSLPKYERQADRFRRVLHEEIIGKIDDRLLAPNVRSRKVYDEELWTGYEVVMDVWPDVFAWGILCVPQGIKPGERRPVVVCQHGLEGLPRDTIDNNDAYRSYKSFTARLAERGFITFAPHNLYRGFDRFRFLQHKANALGLTLFSIIIGQHKQTLNWLSDLPNVHPKRIGFYGLSYGGKTAVRVPPIETRYCLSICSADYNDWIRKNATVDARHSYMFTGEWEIFEFNLGNTFNYAELSSLMAPRPFMVERGHDDGVAPDEWVAYEFAKVRRLYNQLGIGDRAEIEFFDGPHTINGQGTFDFLHRHLKWPEPTDG